MTRMLNEFICTKCGDTPWVDEGDPLICEECGGQLIDTGKTITEWSTLYRQRYSIKKSKNIDGRKLNDFIRETVVDSLGTFDQATQNKVRKIPNQSYAETNEFICIKCGDTPWIEEGDSLICEECGGQLIDTGKTLTEWSTLYRQRYSIKKSKNIDGRKLNDFIREIVVEPLGTFNETLQINRRSKYDRMLNEKLHCPRCSSTNIQGNQGGFEYAFGNGVGSSGYGWNSETSDNLVITGRNRCKCNTCGYTWRP